MDKKLLLILVLSILVASTLVGCNPSPSPSPSPSTLTILSITEGNVSVMKAGTGNWIEAQVGMSLEAGDSIKTGGNSSAEITFFDGSIIELQAGTEIEIISLGISPDTGSTTITLEQTIGNTISRVTKLLDPASRYEVETPTGVVAVRGSAVEIHVIEDGTTWMCNLEGYIWAVAEGVELEVPEGWCCIIRPDEPPELAWKLAISSTSGGSVKKPGEGSFTYNPSTVVSLIATALSGYQFVEWSGDVDTIDDINDNSTTIIMNDNYSIQANFMAITPVQYSLTISSSTHGSVIAPGEGTFIRNAGGVVNLEAAPDDYCYFVNWTGNVGTIANVNAPSTTITMNGDYSITANFIILN